MNTSIAASKSPWSAVSVLLFSPWDSLASIGSRRRSRLIQLSFEVLALIAAREVAIDVAVLWSPFSDRVFTRPDALALAPPLASLISLWLATSLYLGAYRSNYAQSIVSNLTSLIETALAASVVTICVGFFSQSAGADISRSLVATVAAVAFPTVILARIAALMTAAKLEAAWPAPTRVAIVGPREEAIRIAQHLERTVGVSLIITGVVSAGQESGAESKSGDPIPVLGQLEDLAVIVNRTDLDRLIVVNEGLSLQDRMLCHDVARRMHLLMTHSLGPISGAASTRLTVMGEIVGVDNLPRHYPRAQHIVKRVLDVLLATLLLVVLAPLMLLIAAMIALTSEGPILYRSVRVGKGGRHFTFFKFRSMRQGSFSASEISQLNEHKAHVFKIRRDPRVTPVGRVIRRFSLDELPQLINVLAGDMSLVGPRPLPATDLDPDGQSREFRHWSELRSTVPPGITGLWQVSGRSELPFEQWLALDTAYVERWSLWLDFQILCKTPLAVLSARGAF